MERSTARRRVNMLLLTSFGIVALVLAAIGIDGLGGLFRRAAHPRDGASAWR